MKVPSRRKRVPGRQRKLGTALVSGVFVRLDCANGRYIPAIGFRMCSEDIKSSYPMCAAQYGKGGSVGVGEEEEGVSSQQQQQGGILLRSESQRDRSVQFSIDFTHHTSNDWTYYSLFPINCTSIFIHLTLFCHARCISSRKARDTAQSNRICHIRAFTDRSLLISSPRPELRLRSRSRG